MVKRRKRRSDRNHIVYKLVVGRQSYIGVTHVEDGSVPKSMRRRLRKHITRAFTEQRAWKLCVAIRKYGPEKINVEIIEVIRGKEAAHQLERALIRELKPKLNTDVR